MSNYYLNYSNIKLHLQITIYKFLKTSLCDKYYDKNSSKNGW